MARLCVVLEVRMAGGIGGLPSFGPGDASLAA